MNRIQTTAEMLSDKGPLGSMEGYHLNTNLVQKNSITNMQRFVSPEPNTTPFSVVVHALQLIIGNIKQMSLSSG